MCVFCFAIGFIELSGIAQNLYLRRIIVSDKGVLKTIFRKLLKILEKIDLKISSIIAKTMLNLTGKKL